MCFHYHYLPMKKDGPFIWTNLNSLHSRIFLLFRYYFPLEKVPPLTKIESPSLKDALCRLKLGLWYWRRFYFVRVLLLFRYYLPLEKGETFPLNKLASSWPKDSLCQVWWKLARWFWRRRWKCERCMDRRTVDGQQAIRKTHLNFQVR